MQDLGDRLRLVVMAHRRIKITGQILDSEEEAPKGKLLFYIFYCNKSSTVPLFCALEMTLKFPLFKTTMTVFTEETDEKRRRKLRNRIKKQTIENKSEGSEAKVEQKEEKVGDKPATEPLLMVEVENLVHKKFKQTEEVKALTQEVIKTIRDIISLNPLYRDSLQQMMHQGQRVVDNPVYLSDLGAALTAAESKELQEVLEEMDVGPMKQILNLISFT